MQKKNQKLANDVVEKAQPKRPNTMKALATSNTAKGTKRIEIVNDQYVYSLFPLYLPKPPSSTTSF